MNRIQYDERAEATSYMVFPDEDTSNSIVAFFPDGRMQTVQISDPPFEVRDRGEDPGLRDQNDGEYLASFRTEDEAAEALGKLHKEHETSEDEDYPRFTIESIEWMECPQWFLDARVKMGWNQTDGWRGHTTFTPPEGWETLTYGWVTGYPDETVGHKVTASDVFQDLTEDKDVVAPVPILWCFGTTSNVFSTSSNVMIPEGTADEVNAWLDGMTGVTAEGFDRAFS